VRDVFLPPHDSILNESLKCGYIVRGDEQTLLKVDLETLEYIKTIQLNLYNCVPTSVTFIAIGMYSLPMQCIY